MRHWTLAKRCRSGARAAAALPPHQRLPPACQHVAPHPLRRSVCAALLLAATILLCPCESGPPGRGLLAAAQVPAGDPGLSCTIVTDISSPWQPQTVLPVSLPAQPFCKPTASVPCPVRGEQQPALSKQRIA